MGVGRGSVLLGTFLCSRLLQNMKFLMPNADYHCAPFLNELHCLFKRIFFFLGLTKAKHRKHPNLSCFEGVAQIHSYPRKAQGFLGRSMKINMKLGNAKTLSVSDHLCGRLIPKKSKADTELSPNVFEVICPISEASEATSTKRSFFFSSFIFVLCSSRRTRRGQKKLFRLATWLSLQKCSNCSCCHCTFMYK